MKMRFIAVVVMVVMVVGQLLAVPARRKPITVTQPDGTTVTVQLCGDEYHHFYMTQEGEAVTCGEDGYFYYTTLDAYNTPVASAIRLGAAKSHYIDNVAVLKRHGELNGEMRMLKSRRIASRRAPMSKSADKTVSASEIKGLVLLVNFKDKSFVTPQATIDDMMNKEGYTDSYGSIGSARDYFKAQSYGQFVPDFDVVGPVTLSRNMSYYGANDSFDQDQYPDVMVSEACEIASEQGLVDMSDYDLDGDGWVDLVYVIYAGYAESSGAAANTIWPHAWYIYQGAGRTVEVDGVKLDAYACSSELYGVSGRDVDGIGTFCHEYSHTLGLPDFYDIDYSGAMGMGEWSIMDSGCYAMDGYVPIGYNAFERYSCGWLTLNELTQPESVEMPYINSDSSAAYRVSSTNENQYITLETRTNEGWDVGLPAEGMMVVAIDYDANVWEENAPNDNPSRQRVKLIPADNKWSERNMNGDLYPYGGNNKLTSTSSPAMKVHSTTITDKPITNIAYNQGVVTFDFMGGRQVYIEAPVATAAGIVTNHCFTAYWSLVSGATSYDLYVERVDEGEVDSKVAFEENFDGFTASSSIDITNDLDEYTTQSGWSGYKVFCNNGMVKLGSSKAGGLLTTPTFTVAEGHTVYFEGSSYNTEAESGLLSLIIDYDGESAYCEVEMREMPCGELTAIAIKSPYGASECTLTFDCDKRLYIDNLRIVNGIEEEALLRQTTITIDARTGVVTRNNAPISQAEVVSESYTFKGITTTQYEVTKVVNDLYPGIYRYKVRAVTDEGRSEWSNVIEVAINDGSSVDALGTSTTHIYATGGTICIDSEVEQSAVIYNLQGAVVAIINVAQGENYYTPSTRGIYIIKCGTDVVKVGIK